MEKGYAPAESAPPYPGPPLHYPGHEQPAMYPPPQYQGFSGYAPPYPGPPMQYPGGQPMCPPPQGGFQGPAYTQQVPTTVVVHSPAPMLFSTALQDVSGQAMCPHCRQTVLTHIQPTPGLLTWLLFGGLCLFGFCICSCIPFCVESCQDMEHHCPNCRRVIYVYKRMK